MNRLEEKMAVYGQMTEDALDSYLAATDCLQKDVVRAMRYSALGGGKRIRPFLTLEFHRLCGGVPEDALPFACAVEMIHCYSLIHDDLPCMDDSALRRGKPSCHKAFGEDIALLAGDALLPLAFETLLNSARFGKIKEGLILRAGIELARAAGAYGMVGGQVIDLQSEGRPRLRTTLEQMDALKTGALIQVAAKMGCITAGADDVHIEAARQYAKKIGLAFQIVDDILDATADAFELGKPSGSDNQNDKSTYVRVLGLDKSHALASELTTQAKDALAVFADDAQDLLDLADWLRDRDK